MYRVLAAGRAAPTGGLGGPASAVPLEHDVLYGAENFIAGVYKIVRRTSNNREQSSYVCPHICKESGGCINNICCMVLIVYRDTTNSAA